ncbi:uncharacterized protein LOC133818328 [Humulus lupulus]|uniref:uncharacterized protein LOC133818328 n=1 Tax=Humulus lupulus TaxID=3486 RepID=UPI002B402C8B|nr:uncharacterized protein LOC133818328 [Humulus lupulus]
MAAGENQVMDAAAKGPIHMRRNIGRKKGSKGRNRPNRGVPGGVGDSRKPKKIGVKMKNLFRKRARDYNSDGEGGEEEDDDDVEDKRKFQKVEEMSGGGDSSEEAEEEDGNRKEHREDLDDGLSDGNEEEDGDIQPGVTKFTEGCRAFKMAFMSIIKKAIQDDGLGPILSAHKKLVAEKLAEEDAEKKVKKEVRKEKHLMGEKGHVIPANYLDAHEKFLIGVATKGVVKLFNAVNKAQHAQKGLDPSRSKDAKVLRKRRKEAFFSELGKIPSAAKAQTSSGQADDEAPGWAPLRDNYMLTSSKLKGWDKMPDNAATDDIGKMSEDSSSDGDD